MAFQTSVLQNGEWVTRTVDIQTFLTGDNKSTPTNSAKSREAPKCGFLTRTVVESPGVHQILPVRLRSPAHNDVAFISEHYVEIKEFRDGQLHHVAKKNDFRWSIQTAGVLGSFYDGLTGDRVHHDLDVEMTEPPQNSPWPQSQLAPGNLPPQMLVLVLDIGRYAFLFLREDGHGRLDFVCSDIEEPLDRLLDYGGPFQMAIDPSSRYMAVSVATNQFIVYDLEPLEALARQYREKGSVKPIKRWSAHGFQGKIHKMDFLFPPPQDDEAVILCFIVLRENGGGTRLVTYDWELDDDLRGVFSHEKDGLPMATDYSLPLLLIPLTVNTSLLCVAENSIAVYPNVLEGASQGYDVSTENYPASENHLSRRPPVWTTWARPLRRKRFYEAHDHIYLAREDGSITFLETMDGDTPIQSSIRLEETKTSIYKAFAVIGAPNADVVVIGGNCGGGTVWELQARTRGRIIGSIPNWSPALDFATTDKHLTWRPASENLDSDNQTAMVSWRNRGPQDLVKRDRLFTTAGRGIDGSIMEYRQGIPANIILPLECPMPLQKIWAFADFGNKDGSITALLSFHNSSSLQRLCLDGTGHEMDDMDGDGREDGRGCDVSSRTLAAARFSETEICQVTETTISIIASSYQRTTYSFDSIVGTPNIMAENACVRGGLVAFSSMSAHSSAGFEIHVLERAKIGSVLRTHSLQREPTCIEFCSVGNQRFVLAALWQIEHTSICLYPVDAAVTDAALEIRILAGGAAGSDDAAQSRSTQLESPIDAITSMVIIYESTDKTVIAGGSRGGFLIVLEVSKPSSLRASCRVDRLSNTPVEVVPTADSPKPTQAIFAYWDADVVLLKDYDVATDKFFCFRERLIASSPQEPGTAKDIEIYKTHSVAHVTSDTLGTSVVLLATNDKRLLVTLPKSESELVPRQMILGCPPRRLIYSHSLQCLVAAVMSGNMKAPTLVFVDPDTGRLTSRAKGSDSEDREYAKGLGQRGDQIHALYEWVYEKAGQRFAYLLVGTEEGRLLVISPEWKDGEIHYKTRFKTDALGQPVHSIHAKGENIFVGCGSTIHWQYLDSDEKKLKPRTRIEADSNVMSISISSENILYAVTQNDSLQAIYLDVAEQVDHVAMSDAGYLEAVRRTTTHMIEVGDPTSATGSWPVVLVSDLNGEVSGLWVPGDARSSNSSPLQELFSGSVPSIIRTFRRAHTRPSWWLSDTSPRYGRIPSTADDAEVLGSCLDGSMTHVTLLDDDGWRLLRLVQNLGFKKAHTFMQGFRPPPEMPSSAAPHRGTQSHVDGDFLRIILDRKVLEMCLEDHSCHSDGGEMEGEDEREDDASMLKVCLDALDGGRWTAGFEDSDEKYLALSYDVIRYFLRPVF